MPKLNYEEMSTFLDERGHLLRVATVDEDGMPRLAPVWFVVEGGETDGAEILFTPRSQSVFLANLRRDGRLALSIDEDALPYRKVSVQGVAKVRHEVGNDDAWRDTYRSIVERYLDVEGASRYLAATADQERALLAVPLTGAKVTSWRMPVGDESATGIWAARYYGEGTSMADRVADTKP